MGFRRRTRVYPPQIGRPLDLLILHPRTQPIVVKVQLVQYIQPFKGLCWQGRRQIVLTQTKPLEVSPKAGEIQLGQSGGLQAEVQQLKFLSGQLRP